MPTPADFGPGRPWRPGTLPPAPIDPELPSADIRIGYARCSTLGQELDSQLDALSKHGIPRDKIFSEKISTRRAGGESVEQIQPDLIIPTGKRKGHNLLCRQHLPGARRTRQARGIPRSRRTGHADFAALQDEILRDIRDQPAVVLPR
ncbi:hypothetical protein [Streptomyces sp. NPDC002122]|uniref:hypothetical protein n=1 Tax=Streptomyces sp. NPDC002122 TaxID=3154407 RepID=UPI003326AC7E